jgi:hypothetical protein
VDRPVGAISDSTSPIPAAPGTRIDRGDPRAIGVEQVRLVLSEHLGDLIRS